jgi:arylsulfatase A-like enzyme
MQAFEYLKNQRPRVLMIALGETDEFGHAGRYDLYLRSACIADRLIGELWKWVQSDSIYMDHTTLIVTTDHGRGRGRWGWKRHGRHILHSKETWIAMMGPETDPSGESNSTCTFYNAQIAPTIATLLGVSYTENEPKFTGLHESNVLEKDYFAVNLNHKRTVAVNR